jgi:hypothetical protein
MSTNQFNIFIEKLNEIQNYSCFYLYDIVKYLPCIGIQEDNLDDYIIKENQNKQNIDIDEISRKYKKTVNIDNNYFK